MSEYVVNQFNKAIRAKAVHRRWIAALLCLSILAGLGTVSLMTVSGKAATYKDKVLDCHYVPPSGPGYADFAAHTHNDDCYDGDKLVCPLTEIQAHYHDESCYTEAEVLVCGLEENDGHVHDENCYSAAEGEPVCGLEESDGHQHNENCYTSVRGDLICGLEEGEEHTHSDACYAWTEELSCGLEEGEGAHRHSEACGLTEPVLICGKEIGEGTHHHDESCYETRRVLSCGLQGLHVHSDSCYNENGELICGQLHLEAHVHGGECFKIVERDEKDQLNKEENDSELPLPEDNYFEDGMPESDPEADLEYAEIWDAMFAELALSGSWADDLLQVAASQLGYRESTSNFMLGARREMKGYTRYGAWYGLPYGDWCAMFIAFCLNYADIPEAYMPRHCSCQSWVELLKEKNLFGGAVFVQPQPGDLIFYDFDHDDWADHVGLVFAVDGESGRLTTLEGNRNNNVSLYELGAEDPSILGYGALPENPYDVPYSQAVRELAEKAEAEQAGHDGEENDETPEEIAMPAQSFDGETATLHVHVEAEEGTFPAGTQMVVAPVLTDEVLDKAGSLVDGQIVRVQAVDITFLDAENKTIEPAKPVRVSMTMLQKAITDNQEIVHVVGDGSAEIVAQDDSGSDDELCFVADSFSIYAVLYTVDFHFDGYVYQIPGGSTVKLGQVLAELGIVDTVLDGVYGPAAVESVVFSSPELVAVDKGEKLLWLFGDDDWTLESLAPFDSLETLTVTMKDGKVITIAVTDDQAEQLYDLSDSDIVKKLRVTLDQSSTGTELERNAALKLKFVYELKDEVLRAIDDSDKPFTLVYDLSKIQDSSDFPAEIMNYTNGVISIGSRKLGTYTIVDGKVSLNFTDTSYFDGRTEFMGYFNMTLLTDERLVPDDGVVTYIFPGTDDKIPVQYKKTVQDGSKSVNAEKDADGNYTLHYTANVNVNDFLNSMTFNDVLGGLQTLDAASVKINGNAVSVSQSGQSFSFDVASALGTEGVAKGSYQVTYDTKVTEAQLKAMQSDKTTETNKANWKVNGDKEVPGGETKIELEKPKEPIPVEKTVDKANAQPGDTLTYTVTFGKDTTALAGFHISDYITDVAIPQGEKVTLSFNGQTVQVPFGDQARDSNYSAGSVTLFDYTFPDDTPGNGPVTATYTEKLIDKETAKASGVYDETAVNNMAAEHRQNTSDQETTKVTYDKEPSIEVEKTITSTSNPVWQPGDKITYKIKIGDGTTPVAGAHVKDVMTDDQVLSGDVMIQLPDGTSMKLNDYVPDAVVYRDDGQYSTNDVDLLNFKMPADAGNGPYYITYTTQVISQEQAAASGIFGDVAINNRTNVGKNQDHTHGKGVFEPYPISKTVTQGNVDVNGQTVEIGSTVHYTLTFGKAGVNLAGKQIIDEMTDLQKLVGGVTITKADGTSFAMPMGTGQYAMDGVTWNFSDDGKYSDNTMVRVFGYQLPQDIGEGPITVEYDAQIISEEEAKESGITDTKSAFNRFSVDNHSAETEVKIDFPKEVTHNPQVRKEFDHWDVPNSKVYWNIIVEKDADSAYPLENVTVREAWDRNLVSITEGNQGYYGYNQFNGSYFDIIHAVVSTDDGTELTPGVDYTIDKDTTTFTFPVLNERVHINLAFLSPAKIIDGYYMENEVRLNNNDTGKADQTYHKPEVEAVKNGKYDEDSRIVTWEVQINPKAKSFTDSNPPHIFFSDLIPRGMTLVNYTSNSEDDPSIHVKNGNSIYDVSQNEPVVENYTDYSPDLLKIETQADGSTRISADLAAWQKDWTETASPNPNGGLNNKKVVVTYKTKLSDEEWDRITSSASGTGDFTNKAQITAGDGETFEATDTVTITSDEYLSKTDTTQHTQQGSSSNVVVDEGGDNSKNITYRIDVNPHGHVLNLGQPLTLTDYIATNMDLDPASVKLTPADSEAELPEDIVISYNDDSRLLTLRNIPDGTHFVVTYTCIARAQGEDTFRNTATLIGGGSHSASTNEKHTVQTPNAGVKVNGIEVYLFKIDENQIAKTLGGAKFQLFECELAIGDLRDRDVYPQQWWSELLSRVDRMTAGQGSSEDWEYINSNFKINSYKPVGEPAVTKDDGYTQFTTLSEHKLYAWKEIEAPEGYATNGEFHYFVAYQHINVNSDVPQPLLSEEEQLANKQAAWALDDACQFANNIRVASMANLTTWTATNVKSEYTSITATKIWEGDSDNLFETRPKDGIRLQLWRINPDGTREKYGEPVAINADDNGDWPTYVWNRLPSEDSEGKAYKYTVVEEKVDNYTTTYTDNGEGKTSGEIVVVNRMIPKSTEIHVKKVFENVPETAFPAQIQVTLWQVRTDKDGAVQEPEELGDYTIALSAANEWKGKFEKLPTTVAQDGKPYSLTYFVREEDAVAGSFKVSYTFDGKMLPAEGVLETQEDNPIVITNSIPEQDFTVNKVWHSFNGQENEEWPQDKSITVELYRSDVPDEQQLTLTLARPTTALGDEPEPQPIGGDAADDYQSVTYTLTESGTHLYTLHLEHLPKLPDDAYYYLREQSGEGFAPHYGNSRGEKQNDLQEARDGEYLINELNGGYELPEAGGIGTHAFTALGAALLVGAALGYAWLSRIRRKEPGQDRA